MDSENHIYTVALHLDLNSREWSIIKDISGKNGCEFLKNITLERVREITSEYEKRQDAIRNSILKVLQAKFGEVPKKIQDKLKTLVTEKDLEWPLKKAALSQTLKEFEEDLMRKPNDWIDKHSREEVNAILLSMVSNLTTNAEKTH